MNEKLEKALQLSEQLLEEIELEKISLVSISLQCLRLARLMSDNETMKWLQYEISGYPKREDGCIELDAFNIGWEKGRGYYDEAENNSPRIFLELASQLEDQVDALKLSLGTITTNGVSVSGDHALLAMKNLSSAAFNNANNIRNRISGLKRRISILKGQYYQYALKVNIELNFSKGTGQIFDNYRENVDIEMIKLVPNSIQKLQAVYSNLNSKNPEEWSQALTSCRRLFEDVADALFKKLYPNYEEKKYRTKSGKDLDITGDKYINRLYAVIDTLQDKSVKNTLEGSHILYIIDWIENLHSKLCKGVHDDITYDEAKTSILHCYIGLGDIINITKSII